MGGYESEIEVLFGTLKSLDESPKISFFDPDVINFLANLSSSILNDTESRNYGDVIAFAYWIRKSNLDSAKAKYQDDSNRLGYGMCLHIAPSNVPMNFAYSLVCSLLAGNRNIVRVPSRKFPQVDFLLAKLKTVLDKDDESKILHAICIVRYHKNDFITKNFLSLSNLKIVWGGDRTVNEIRGIDTPAQCKEIVFPDRKSVSILDEKRVLSLTDHEVRKLAENFYTDTYLFDQNACSSPRIVFWVSNSENSLGKKRFWKTLEEIVYLKYEIEPRNLMLKFTELAQIAALSDQARAMESPGKLLTRFSYDPSCKPLSSQLVNRFGAFFEHDLQDLADLASLLDNRIQTLTYFGVDPVEIVDFVLNCKLKGVDRVVPVGQALDFDMTWDGYDLPRTLSRLVTFKSSKI